MASLIVEQFYWLPYCSTCVKAEQYLLGKGATINQYVNLKEERIDKAILETLCNAMGGVDALFSKRAMKYRAWGLHEKTLSDEEMLQYMQDEYTFIKRPVLRVATEGSKPPVVLAGFSAKQYDKLF